MKNTAIIFLSFFYLLLYAGIPVTIHYCHGNAEKVKLFSAENINCCCGPNACLSKKCCYNEHHLIKADIKEQLNEQRVQLTVYDDVFLSCNICIANENESDHKPLTIPFFGHSPPKQIPLWLLNCTLIYYS
jgi:hypothetical protein